MKSLTYGLLATCALVSVALAAPQRDATYVAHLQPLNASVAGSEAKGVATFKIKGDQLTIVVDMQGTPEGIMHLQHFHGFPHSQKTATCATPAADVNKDGIIDLIETEPMSGTTMVPFNADPVGLKIVSDTYPKASPKGAYHYEKTMSLQALQDAFAKAFGGQKLDLDKRVVYIHGVFAKAKLPATVASLGTIPAHITLPIACGKIELEK